MQCSLARVRAIKITHLFQSLAPVSLMSIHPKQNGMNTHEQKKGATPFN